MRVTSLMGKWPPDYRRAKALQMRFWRGSDSSLLRDPHRVGDLQRRARAAPARKMNGFCRDFNPIRVTQRKPKRTRDNFSLTLSLTPHSPTTGPRGVLGWILLANP